MARVIILLLAGFLLYYLWTYFKRLSPQQRKAFVRKYAGVILLGVAIVLVVTGRLHWIGAAIAALIPIFRHLPSLVMRWWPLINWFHKTRFGNPVMSTRFLKVSINSSNGAMEGKVSSGDHEGADLDSLSESELQELLVTYRKLDPESSRLLSAYMNRRFRAESYRQNGGNEAGFGNLTRSEALQILGLEESASREDIVRAHKSLMQKVHPDRGGSDYLAAKINQAKDFLLKT